MSLTRYPHNGDRAAWLHLLTFIAGVSGCGNPPRAERIARIALATVGGPPRSADSAEHLLEVIFNASQRTPRVAYDPDRHCGLSLEAIWAEALRAAEYTDLAAIVDDNAADQAAQDGDA